MSKVKISSLIIILSIYFTISFGIIFLIIRYGGFPPSATWVLPIIVFIFSSIVFYNGWQVKKYKEKQNDKIDAIFASKVIVRAKIASYSGACLAGFCLAQTILFIIYKEALYLQNMIFIALMGFLSSILMTVTGILVENWCTVDDDDSYDSNIIDKKNLSPSY